MNKALEHLAAELGLDDRANERMRLEFGYACALRIDGCGHAAVSGSYAVANALAGKALQAADYAAYAMVYGQGGYGAVADRQAFEPEFRWQVSCLASLAERRG